MYRNSQIEGKTKGERGEWVRGLLLVLSPLYCIFNVLLFNKRHFQCILLVYEGCKVSLDPLFLKVWDSHREEKWTKINVWQKILLYSTTTNKQKLEGIGPVDNRASTNMSKKWHMTCDMWHVTWDRWQVTHETWHMTYDTWHKTGGEHCFEDLEEKDD